MKTSRLSHILSGKNARYQGTSSPGAPRQARCWLAGMACSGGAICDLPNPYLSLCEGAVSAAQTQRPIANAIMAHNKMSGRNTHRTNVGAPFRAAITRGTKKITNRRGIPFNSRIPMRWIGRSGTLPDQSSHTDRPPRGSCPPATESSCRFAICFTQAMIAPVTGRRKGENLG